ncbi:hypothetical protein ATPR_2555 [Acetobacter tropicalis NBRC 101654]|uniref:Uncharacterized protein n=1 Tax=Acetobacter tropicalis NBRC 101654 TaxID=749388 RepID=F7VGQ6_9PROT|nr:hypothetical protein ATPR_2555 [Acetobacter tropicalis NBRC 101654]
MAADGHEEQADVIPIGDPPHDRALFSWPDRLRFWCVFLAG